MSFWIDAGWQEISVFALGSLLILGGVSAFIFGLIREDKEHKRSLRRPDMSVGRDAYRDVKGTHR